MAIPQEHAVKHQKQWLTRAIVAGLCFLLVALYYIFYESKPSVRLVGRDLRVAERGRVLKTINSPLVEMEKSGQTGVVVVKRIDDTPVVLVRVQTGAVPGEMYFVTIRKGSCTTLGSVLYSLAGKLNQGRTGLIFYERSWEDLKAELPFALVITPRDRPDILSCSDMIME